MKKHLVKAYKGRKRRIALIAAGIIINVLFSFVMYRLGLPFFFDTIGTVMVTAAAGVFPGIITGVFTNVFCMFYNESSLFFAFINAFAAIITAQFIKYCDFSRKGRNILLILSLALFSGVTSTAVQWWLYRDVQYSAFADMGRAIADYLGSSVLFGFMITNVLLNILDKGIAVLIAILFIRFIPDDTLNDIRNAGWRQAPISTEETKSFKLFGRGVFHSVGGRMVVSSLAVTIILVVIMANIGLNQYFENSKSEKIEEAWNAVTFAAEYIDTDKIEDYIKNGEEVEGYLETEELLRNIRNNALGVKYLYVVRVDKKKCTFIFDLDSVDNEGYSPGDQVDIEEEFKEYVPNLLKGEIVGPIESKYTWGWVSTVYYPVTDDGGRVVCYVGADVSMNYLEEYATQFLVKVLLILSGFFILITAFAIWITSVYTAYPISTMASRVESFSVNGDEQETLDSNVKAIRALDIRTGDEVEKLYKAICDMTLNQAEQMRAIRRLSESTAMMQDGLIITMADMVESRDSDTGAHIQKTAAYVKIIVEALERKGYYAEKITPKFMSDVVRSAPLHDVGKINIPDGILNKPGKLTDEEYEIMKTHTTAGKKIMENAIGTVRGENYLKEARNMAAYHHERWDGRGYPEGLHGEVIPLSARIMAVADVFDALTSPRVYKPAFPLEKALSILQEGAGTQFDPKCVEVFMDSLSEVKVILKKFNPDVPDM